MAKAYVFLADGFEDIEALAPIDIMRRGGVEVVTVGIMGTNEVISAHGVTVLADVPFEFAGDFEDADLLMLPGGKGINVSILLSRLGIETTALGFKAGFTGEEIERLLGEEDVRCDFISCEGSSRINI